MIKIVNCAFCDKEFIAKRSGVINNSSIFCNRKCFIDFKIATRYYGFYDHIEVTKSCWIWGGSVDKNGYGKFCNGRSHRFSYFLHFGEFPKDMWVLHTCDNPQCVNPNHLFIGTNQDNVDDRERKNRGAKGLKNGSYTKPETRRIGSLNGLSKFTEEQIVEIRNMSPDKSQSQIAKIFNTTQVNIGRIINRKTWKHVV